MTNVETTKAIVEKEAERQVFRALVESLNGDEVYIIRDGQTTRDPDSYMRGARLELAAGDPVLVIKVGDGWVVVTELIGLSNPEAPLDIDPLRVLAANSTINANHSRTVAAPFVVPAPWVLTIAAGGKLAIVG